MLHFPGIYLTFSLMADLTTSLSSFCALYFFLLSLSAFLNASCLNRKRLICNTKNFYRGYQMYKFRSCRFVCYEYWFILHTFVFLLPSSLLWSFPCHHPCLYLQFQVLTKNCIYFDINLESY